MEKNWKIDYSAKALFDIINLKTHLYELSRSEQTTKNKIAKIENAVKQLDHQPFRYPLTSIETFRTKEIRFMPIDKYIVLYLPNKDSHTVSIVRIIYGKMDMAHLDLE
ncbi:type II toxin-antitoxin system RelE/ParE family toxin [Xylocopilactobacillus apis]|uniref:Addiction module toxin RelE n=1 Tax=Xylocopilactobacillus apis TaxID=2932183 RepID=A0AAU9DC69_9LACO|nr:type II toxin-antitoxin system RelE/ParE family toxin [Xylocopilactobacillus apis]BDR55756.1 addiction module toxin RelE [Xylocopilactobacillus apis]